MSILSAFWLVVCAALVSYGAIRLVVSGITALAALLDNWIVRRDTRQIH